MTDRARFEESFPQLDSATLELQEIGYMVRGKNPWRLTESDLPVETLPCSNPSCIKGNFVVGGILYRMIQGEQTTLEATQRCNGTEHGRACLNVLIVKATISYR